MRANQINYSQPEEIFISLYCQRIEERYKAASPLKLPKSESAETMIKKICQLARDNKIENLRELMLTCDERLLKYWAVELLARAGNEKAVNLLIKQFDADKNCATRGYAWGGQSSILACTRTSLEHKLEGFALGRHITEVNRILDNEEGNEQYLVMVALDAYIEGGHVENLPDTFELITLTTHPELKRQLAYALKEKIETLDVNELLTKAEKLAAFMEEHKTDDAQSITIVTDRKSSPTFFKQATLVNATNTNDNNNEKSMAIPVYRS
ncbi:MAG: hypothetical protein EPO11_04350 [Gammaproteobacteria bacterium]|nr:MAG: hypothetical protein EPO11_04350 [Gammaproteobacteria bacterium]